MLVDIRMRSAITDVELEQKVGKLVTDADSNVRLTGPSRVRKPDGTPLCTYLPGAVRQFSEGDIYDVLHGLRSFLTDNRGAASGTPRTIRPHDKRSRSKKVSSSIIGAFEAGGPKQFCRLTGWTGKNVPKWQILYPLFQQISAHFQVHEPQRYERQMVEVGRCDPNWIVPGTPFTTVTVNNTYPTGVHTDKGDLAEGFSTLAVFRRGLFEGGVLTFPKYRVSVDMQDGDLLLMDAHEFHGNTPIVPTILGETPPVAGEDYERISVVCYFRSKMVTCGSPDEEYHRAAEWAEKAQGR